MNASSTNNIQHQIEFAEIKWQAGQPFSARFNDVYFSSDNGLAESHYVFLDQNQLANRFKSCLKEQFTIAETGFGTGLNFLSTWKLWNSHAPSRATLHFISCEKFPISPQDLILAHQQWPELTDYSEELIKRYQLINNETKSITLIIGNVKLSLLFDDASTALSQQSAIDINARAINSSNIKVDAWFLDGFAPSKNPDMWTDQLFQQMARLSHTNTTFATFTSASAVRKGLQQAGFTVNKLPGFGKKREMLAGKFNGHAQSE